jgi:methionyl-tRNA formyltransferase
MNVLLVAEEAAGLRTLELLAASKHRVVAVATGAGGEERGASVAGLARRLGVEAWPSRLVRDPSLAERLERERVDLLLNVHSLYVVDTAVLAAPRVGSFNLHPGPLPEYAGLSAPSWAIYNGERRHGVTLHWMGPRVDAGPIAYERPFEIGARDSGLSVSVACVRHGLPLVKELLSAAERDAASIPAREQDLSRQRYFSQTGPHGGRLPWALPARRLVDFVRASDYSPFPSPWGHPRTRLAGEKLEVVQAATTGAPADAPPGTIGAERAGGVLVAAADEWVVLERIRLRGASAAPSAVLRAGSRLDPGPLETLSDPEERG